MLLTQATRVPPPEPRILRLSIQIVRLGLRDHEQRSAPAKPGRGWSSNMNNFHVHAAAVGEHVSYRDLLEKKSGLYCYTLSDGER